jgi:hypothetical protein
MFHVTTKAGPNSLRHEPAIIAGQKDKKLLGKSLEIGNRTDQNEFLNGLLLLRCPTLGDSKS